MIGVGIGLTLVSRRALLPESEALFAAFTTAPTARRAAIINRDIDRLKEAGLWSKIDALGLIAAETAQAARVDWKAPSRVGTLGDAPTFTADRGYAFDGSNDYIDTGFIPSTHATPVTGMTGTSMLLGVYERTDVGATTRAAGAQTGATQNLIVTPRSGAGMISGALNSGQTGLGAVADSRGLTIIETDGTNGRAVKNGVPGTPAALTTPGSSLPTHSIWLGGYNNAGSLAQPRASQLALWVAGPRWTDQNHTDFHTIMVTGHLAEIGATV
ncbi:MAG: hypothetical protein ACK4RV_02235 [Caulobacter sp.]